ncbi:branched-chain amino acid ABC transporter substrate-binding protein [Oxalobacteraceae bacterium R-40]|uniref:Branched-chain amino acid ABC transporter substrate-binding protein n=1 Tax=Keguizhuia sedimenti TaxID=3064264 RepID=A0ABU1BP97_9BURK|nr:branched-chain amino acid ABC transporter substrate-binding protein [Oxalobacteraceae bacterium R-40]
MQIRTVLLPVATTIGLLVSGSISAQEMVIKLGHVSPMSGGQAHFGRDNANGAILAVEDLNAKGMTIGGKKVKFQLLNEDDAADPKQGTAVAQKLVDARVNGVIGHLNSGTTIPASKIYHDAGIPQISPSATNPKYTQQNFKGAFRVVANDSQLGGALGRYAVETLQAKQIAVIDDRTAYGQGVADEFVKGVKAKAPGMQIVRQYTNDKATDFNAILTAIKGKKPDVIFFGGMDNVAAPMLRQMKQLGINVKYMGGDGLCTTKLPELAGNGLGENQVICAEAGGVTGAKEKDMEQFHARYKKRFNMDVQLYAPYVYDAVMTMATAMQKANSAEPAKYLPELAKINYEGVTGTIAFDNKGDLKNGALTLFTYKGGKKEKMLVLR